MANKKKINYKLIRKIGLLILAMSFFVGLLRVAYSIPQAKEAIALATTKKAETFTELYFENHISLPKIIKRYEFYNFTFTLHNLEQRDMEYSYVIYVQRDNEKIILNKGKAYVKSDEYKSVREDFGPLKNLRSKIVVEIINKNQSIHFWIEEQ